MARQMKDSGIEWIGEIPETWDTIKFKYLFSITGGNGFPENLQGQTEGTYPFCKVSDINGHSDYVDTAANYVSDEVAKVHGFNIIPCGSIIIAKIGAALQKNHRKINSVPCCIDNNTQALVPIRTDSLRYLLYLTRCIDMGWFDNNSTVPSLNNNKLLNFFVPNVSVAEQQRIAAFLDRKCAEIDAVIERTKATIEEYKKFKQAVITEAVTKGVRGPRPMKDSGIEWIGEIPEEWMLQKLKNVTRLITDGTHVTPNYIESGVPFLSIKDISSGRIDFGDAKYISAEEHQQLSKSTPIEKGDMLFTRIGTLGVFVFVDTDTVFDIFVSVGLIKFRSSISKANKHFIRYFLLSTCTLNYINLVKAGGGTAAAKFNLTDVRNTVFAVPPSDEQEEIVASLDEKCAALDTLIAKKTALLTELETYKKSLIYEYVTGKKEVI